MKTVFVLLPMEERYRERLEDAGAGCRFVYLEPGVDPDEILPQAEAVIGNPPPEKLKMARKLELLQLSSSGAAEYAAPGVLPAGVKLASATGAYGRSVAEHALAVTLMLLKNLHLYRDAQREGRWTDCGRVGSIDGATVAVVGLGDIGLRYARMCKALGASVIGIKRRAGEKPPEVDELWGPEALVSALKRADVVASFLPGTPATDGLYTMDLFRAMKNSAVFLNCGRGSAVDAQALVRALTEGEIAAASLDVTDPEPLPADSPLWGLKNLLLTPHVSGGFRLPGTFEAVVDIAAHNLRAWLAGEALVSAVDRETGYKE